MKAICKKKKFGPYQSITMEQRRKVIDLVFIFHLSVKDVLIKNMTKIQFL